MTNGLHDLAEEIARRAGIRMLHGRLESLAAAVRRAEPDLSDERLSAALAGEAGDELLDRIIDEVAVKETFFFRDPDSLRAIDWHALLAVAQAAGSPVVRVWSAACATGEEVYTLAILASEAFGGESPPVRVLGTDISPTALERAREGEYGRRSVRKADATVRRRYFEERGAEARVAPRLRDLVEFRRHNLVGDPPPEGAPFDLILCRNVFIYFDAQTAQRAVGALQGALRSGGQLVLGAADQLCVGTMGPGRPAQAPGTPTTTARRPARARRGTARPAPARPVAPRPAPLDREASLGRAIASADNGRLTEALTITEHVLEQEPKSPAAHFVRGLALLASDNPVAAVDSFRAALYFDPTFAIAAFKLGRAYDALGDDRAARRSYEQALRIVQPDDDRHSELFADIDVADVAAACRARLAAPTAIRH